MIRISDGCGGLTSTSSITIASPALHATAALHLMTPPGFLKKLLEEVVVADDIFTWYDLEVNDGNETIPE